MLENERLLINPEVTSKAIFDRDGQITPYRFTIFPHKNNLFKVFFSDDRKREPVFTEELAEPTYEQAEIAVQNFLNTLKE